MNGNVPYIIPDSSTIRRVYPLSSYLMKIWMIWSLEDAFLGCHGSNKWGNKNTTRFENTSTVPEDVKHLAALGCWGSGIHACYIYTHDYVYIYTYDDELAQTQCCQMIISLV